MQRLTETECEVIEFLQETQDKVSKGRIIAKATTHPTLLSRCLDRLVRRNYISQVEEYGFSYYYISDTNKKMKTKNVKCPKCNKVRRVFNESQTIALCKNKECKTPSGKRTVFWLIKRSVKLSEGQIQSLNLV